MTESESTLLLLIRKALFLDETIMPETTDWEAVLREAQTQSVLGILADQLPKESDKAQKQSWQKLDTQRLAGFIRYLYMQDQLHALLVQHGIPYAILKGCAAAVQYPKPMMRTMGDIDFIVPRERFRETWDLLLREGYVFSHGKEGDRHIAFHKDGFSFELHHHFSHDVPEIDAFVDEELQSPVIANIAGHAFSMLPPFANGIVLLDHMRSHLKSGMGLRQTIDWMLYVHRYLDDAAWESGFGQAARTCQLETLAVTATKMCQKYLGLPETATWCKDADEALCDRLMKSLLTEGNFGRKYGAGNKVANVTTSFKKDGLFHRLQTSGENNWKALKKHPGLKPFAWIYQAFRYGKQGLKTGRVLHLKQDVQHGKDRERLMRDLGLEKDNA